MYSNNTPKKIKTGAYPNAHGFRVQSLFETLDEFAKYVNSEDEWQHIIALDEGECNARVLKRLWDENTRLVIDWNGETSVAISLTSFGRLLYSHEPSFINVDGEILPLYALGNSHKSNLWIVSEPFGNFARSLVIDADNMSDALEEMAEHHRARRSWMEIEESSYRDYLERMLEPGDKIPGTEESVTVTCGLRLDGSIVTEDEARKLISCDWYIGKPCDTSNLDIRQIERPDHLFVYGPGLPAIGVEYATYRLYHDSMPDPIRERLEFDNEMARLLHVDAKAFVRYTETVIEETANRCARDDRNRNLSLYGGSPLDLVRVLCRIVWPDSRVAIMPEDSDDAVELKAYDMLCKAGVLKPSSVFISTDYDTGVIWFCRFPEAFRSGVGRFSTPHDPAFNKFEQAYLVRLLNETHKDQWVCKTNAVGEPTYCLHRK